jgi:hypothetical protein
VANRGEGLLKGDRKLGFADLAVFTGVERVAGELLQAVRASARELDDLGHDGGIEPHGGGGERLGDGPGRGLGIERAERMGSKKRASGS